MAQIKSKNYLSHYRGKTEEGTLFYCPGCGEEFSPKGVILCDSSQRGIFWEDQWQYSQTAGTPYKPYRNLQRFVEKHKECVETPKEEYVTEKGVKIVDRRRF